MLDVVLSPRDSEQMVKKLVVVREQLVEDSFGAIWLRRLPGPIEIFWYK